MKLFTVRFVGLGRAIVNANSFGQAEKIISEFYIDNPAAEIREITLLGGKTSVEFNKTLDKSVYDWKEHHIAELEVPQLRKAPKKESFSEELAEDKIETG